MIKRIILPIILFLVLVTISACINSESNFVASSPTADVQISHNQDCWQIKSLQDKKSPSGSLVYSSRTSSEKDSVYYWNISTSQSFPIEIDANLDILVDRIVSPDGKSIARESDKGLAILSAGKVKYSPLPDGAYLSRYLPIGEILLIKYRSENWDSKQRDKYRIIGGDFTDVFYVLNPSTGNFTEHSVTLPMLQTTSHDYFAINYSPDLHYVIYKSNHKQSNNFDTELTLFDIEKNEIVWVGPPDVPNMIGSNSMIPGWNSVTNSLTYVYGDQEGTYSNYYSITLDGKATPLTDFKDVVVNSWGHGWVTYSEWSPDGRYLIFFGDKKSSEADEPGLRELYILDNKNKTVFRTCMPQKEMGYNSQFPDWYFDDSQFIINFTSYGQSGESEMPIVNSSTDLIFDIPSKTIYELPYVHKIDNFISSFGFPPAEFLGWVAWEKP